ncbi:FUSC family protein [Brevundimonas sp. R86498]|uniref:FUSC family protein n=1 Tax=Brevundimonas sp. R86498 TaxID=3093845 RepID=UPI0037C4F89F
MAATYGAMRALDWDHLNWALISALFVLERNSDATRRNLFGRLSGAAAGAAIGLAIVALFPGESLTVLRLPVAAALAMSLAAFHPRQSFALVAAVAVALEPADPAWIGAFERVRAIALGSLWGLTAAMILWREPARARATKGLAEAVARCQDLATILIPSVAHGTDDHRDSLHAAYRDAMRIAHLRIKDCRDETRGMMADVARKLDRVWHDLVFIDRLSRQRPAIHPVVDLEDVRETARRELEAVRCALQGSGPARPAAEVAGGPMPGATHGDRQSEDLLGFVLRELASDLAALRQQVRVSAGSASAAVRRSKKHADNGS